MHFHYANGFWNIFYKFIISVFYLKKKKLKQKIRPHMSQTVYRTEKMFPFTYEQLRIYVDILMY